MATPIISVIIPCRNEASFIARSLGTVLSQDYPADRMEVLVVDGMSDDATREVIARTVAAYPGAAPVTVLDNPGQIAPTGMNIALAHACGEVIIRVDGHCEIAADYLRCCVVALEATGADCSGGPMVTVGDTQVARTIALAQSARFGVGGVAFRTGHTRPSYVDTVAFGAYRREVFERIGGFDEELVRNQDDELNFRLTQAGGKIWLDPSIRSTYYSRASIRKLWRQYYEYGLYKVLVIKKRGAVASWRHLVPALFVLSLCASLLLALFTRRPRLGLLVAGPYAAANLGASVWTARGEWQSLPLLPGAFLTLHFAYGLGFLAGLWRWRKRAH
ncbi:MAG: glycosyltransferase family 2 protein [Chloroflexales bacterium]|nr:glycosyltransferase family 2 protein [Chloroflexales bacterium]